MSSGNIPIESEQDIIIARTTIRNVAKTLNFSLTDVTRIVTSVSELTRNVVQYAGRGIMNWQVNETNNNLNLEVLVEDEGPGIQNIEQTLIEGYSTSGGLGLGLIGTKRLMDEMEIQSEMGKGTKVRIIKWLKQPRTLHNP